MLQRLADAGAPRAAERAASCSSPRASWRCRSRRRCTSTGAGSGLTVVPLYGGAPMEPADPRAPPRRRRRRRDARAARSTTSGAARSSSTTCRVLVLDEADEMLDMGFAEDLEAILEATPADAADGALLGDDAAAHRRDRGAPPEEPGARHDRAREDGRRHGSRASARSPTSSRRAHKPLALGRVLDIENPAVGHRLLPHAPRGRRARRDAERPRLPRGGAARRHGRRSSATA